MLYLRICPHSIFLSVPRREDAVRRRRGHWPPTRRAPGRNRLPRPRFCPHTGIPGALHARHAPPSSFRSTRRGRRRRSRRQCYTRRRAVQPPSPLKPSSPFHDAKLKFASSSSSARARARAPCARGATHHRHGRRARLVVASPPPIPISPN